MSTGETPSPRRWMCECGHTEAFHELDADGDRVGRCTGTNCPCAEFEAEGSVAEAPDKFSWSSPDEIRVVEEK
jgi:hypothetical protein